MSSLHHTAARLFGAPLLIHRAKLDVILSVLGPRLGLPPVAAPPMPVTSVPSARGSKGAGIALIPIHGTLVRRTVGLEAESGLTSYTALAEQLDAAIADPSVQAILLDIDSPGGESAGVFDLAERIRVATAIKPVWAVANDMAFSAAYALAAAASRLFVSRTGGVGSIGVIAMHVDQSAKDLQDGLRYTAVYAGDHKNDLSPHAPMSSEAQAFLQGEVDRIYGVFVDTVARHRRLSSASVRSTQAGLFFGDAAIAAGLADSVGSFDEALSELKRTLPAATATLRSTPVDTSPSMPISTPPPMPTPTSASHSTLNLELPPMTTPPVLAAPAAMPAATSAAADAPHSAPFDMAHAVEIAQTCAIAGRTDLIAGFLEARTDPKAVRKQLLSVQAQASPEISSRIDPAVAYAAAAATDPTSDSNPLIRAVKQRVAAHQSHQSFQTQQR